MIAPVTALESMLAEIAAVIPPIAQGNSWNWICKWGRTEEGRPFDGKRIPWAKGVCEAWDDPKTRQIALMWGTRLGKSMTGMQLMQKVAATAPRVGLFATDTQDLAIRIVRNRLYSALAACPKTAHLLEPEHRWTHREIRLLNALWYVAWSGSPTQLADLSAYYGWANEIDKWDFSESLGGDAGEGDALDQFFNRFKEFWNVCKILLECSPTTKSKSRIYKLFMSSDMRRYHVPCPHCGGHQILRLGAKDQPGGIRFEKPTNGIADEAMARATAYYECKRCEGKILDQHRYKMMNSGVWVPEGCEVDDSGIIHGQPIRDQRIAGFQLSSLYSLQVDWGSVAAEFVLAQKGGKPALRAFVNLWLSEVWVVGKTNSEPEDVGETLGTDLPRGVIPEWATWVFAGVDRQEAGFPFVVIACDADERIHLVDDGVADSEEELIKRVFERDFEHSDGGTPLRPALTLSDSGYLTKSSYQMCKRLRRRKIRVHPCKGANTDCGGEAYIRKEIGLTEGKSSLSKKLMMLAGKGLKLIRVNPWYYEPIIHQMLYDTTPGGPGSLSLHVEAATDSELLHDLCNGYEDDKKTVAHATRWLKRSEKEPNDRRDALKYALCARDVFFAERPEMSIEKRQGPIVVATEVRPREEAPSRHERGRFRPTISRGGRRR